MSSRTEDLLNEQEDQRESRLAEVLDLTDGELAMAPHTIDEDEKDGVTRHILVKFDDSTPPEILAKIKGLDENNTVWLEPHDLDAYDMYPPDEESEEGD